MGDVLGFPRPPEVLSISHFCQSHLYALQRWETPSRSGLSFSMMRWLLELILGRTRTFCSQWLFLKRETGTGRAASAQANGSQ